MPGWSRFGGGQARAVVIHHPSYSRQTSIVRCGNGARANHKLLRTLQTSGLSSRRCCRSLSGCVMSDETGTLPVGHVESQRPVQQPSGIAPSVQISC